jgi:CubicO group peptidase (beta-lactamase class C family)
MTDVKTQAELDAAVRHAVGDHGPGVALVVVGPEGVRARAGVGAADLASGATMTTGTSVPWFSMTKIATATVAMRLAERGTLDLDAPVLPLVPAMQALRPAEWAEAITARHLLQHAGGLVNPIPVSWIHPADAAGPDPDEVLVGLLTRHPKLRFAPGSRSSYSNLGTLTLGAAIARLAGTRFEEVATDEVLEPLKMTSSGFTFASDVPASTGYHRSRSLMRYLVPSWVRGPTTDGWMSLHRFLLDGAAYGGLVGTADDAARFLQMHLRDGEAAGTRVLSATSATEMRDVNLRGRRFDLGLGWFRPAKARDADPAFVEHLGAGAGFFNVMRLYPSLGVGAVVMGNATHYDVDAVAALALSFVS